MRLPKGILCFLAIRDVANVALNHSRAIYQVDVADELHLNALLTFGFQWQIVVTDILLGL